MTTSMIMARKLQIESLRRTISTFRNTNTDLAATYQRELDALLEEDARWSGGAPSQPAPSPEEDWTSGSIAYKLALSLASAAVWYGLYRFFF